MPVQLARPETFSGESGDCRPILAQCEMHFELLPQQFTTERAKIAFRSPISQAEPRHGQQQSGQGAAPFVSFFAIFLQAFAQIFQSFSPGSEAARLLTCLCQERRSVLDYTIEFRTLAAESGWNNAALVDAYISGLSQRIREQLISLDLPDELDSIIAITNRIDRRLQD